MTTVTRVSVSRGIRLIAAAIALLLPRPAWACDTPVFMYAMDHWPADPYPVLVFHRDPIDGRAAQALDRLRQAGAQGGLHLRTVALDPTPDAAEQALWETQTDASLPWVVALYPDLPPTDRPIPATAAMPLGRVAWTGPLDPDSVARLLDSPVRRRIADLLIARHAAVWVLLQSGNRRQDGDALRTLQETLARLERTLRLPVLIDSSGQDVQATIRFPIVSLARDDPAETGLKTLLLNSESDLRTIDAPMVFPIFGRGIVLYALAGAGINPAVIAEAAEFMTGPCSCEVKAFNPGTDLLLTVDWDRRAPRWDVADVPLPFSLADFATRAEQAELQLTDEPGNPESPTAMTAQPDLPDSGPVAAAGVTSGFGVRWNRMALLMLFPGAVALFSITTAVIIRRRNRTSS